ncbi:hypothetical protein [Caudoviricetes sp.]|nr:hypothetical protein [Caudoviricetes sp.]UOF81519.1 hypothetical protein [Caudoviricetes sp.]
MPRQTDVARMIVCRCRYPSGFVVTVRGRCAVGAFRLPARIW